MRAHTYPLELCEHCYTFPRMRSQPLCRSCAELQREAEVKEALQEGKGDRAHLRLLRKTGRTYG